MLLVGVLGLYLVFVLLGLIPVNNDFAETEDGIEIFVYSGAFHSDIVLPMSNSMVDWRAELPPNPFKVDHPQATHMAFGWGDRGFYINTPTWADLKVSTAANALLVPSPTVMHVSLAFEPEANASPEFKSVKISTDQYLTLVQFISDSFAKDPAGKLQRIEDSSYGDFDAFYIGSGNYHAFRTCNCWVGQALKATGIKTGWFTPLPKTVFLYFPD
ncbi:MAG: hypothetical protein ACI814_004757 [Mariniblastus sp.]